MAANPKQQRFGAHDRRLLLCSGIACLTGVAVVGCSTLGPRTIRVDRFNYNQTYTAVMRAKMRLNGVS